VVVLQMLSQQILVHYSVSKRLANEHQILVCKSIRQSIAAAHYEQTGPEILRKLKVKSPTL
jgi:predicted metal-binding protein